MFFRRLVNPGSVSVIRSFCKKPVTTSPFHRQGDTGNSKILSGETLRKDNGIFYAIGSTEELLCLIGLAKEYAHETNHEYVDKLKRIQTVIVEISTALSRNSKESRGTITVLHIKELEEWINSYAKELPPPEKYILPGGGVTSSTLQLARTICRKTERHITPYVRKGTLDKEVQVYLNRLSDFLFTVSRIAAKLDKQNEIIYYPSPDHKLQDQ